MPPRDYDPDLYTHVERGVWVSLLPADIASCWEVGAQMRAHAKRDGARELGATGATEGKAIALHAVGLIGELAASIALGIPYVPRIDTYRRVADVGEDIGVRVNSVARYGLMIRERDKDALRMVQVLTHRVVERFPSPSYQPARVLVNGWYPVGEAKRHAEWRQDLRNDREPPWMVPQSALRDIRELAVRTEVWP